VHGLRMDWGGEPAAWDLSVNYGRQRSLHRALAEDRLLPMAALMKHAWRRLVDRSHERIALYRNDGHSFQFMREAEGGRFSAGAGRLLAGRGGGRLRGDQPPRQDKTLWNPRVAGPVMEAYRECPWPEIEQMATDRSCTSAKEGCIK